MRIMPAFNIMYNELDNAGIESINAFQYDTGIDPTNTIRHNATLVLYQDAETSHMLERVNSSKIFISIFQPDIFLTVWTGKRLV